MYYCAKIVYNTTHLPAQFVSFTAQGYVQVAKYVVTRRQVCSVLHDLRAVNVYYCAEVMYYTIHLAAQIMQLSAQGYVQLANYERAGTCVVLYMIFTQ